jgi:hypothetical protein
MEGITLLIFIIGKTILCWDTIFPPTKGGEEESTDNNK